MSIKIERINGITIDNEAIVSIKKMGDTYEICWCEHKNNKANITKIDKEHYIINATGEVKTSKHIKNRFQNKAQLLQSFKRLRELINTNAIDIKKCKWVTLTYRELITDTEQVYNDFDKFMKRFRYKHGHIEYINVCEPCGNGRWHFHCLMIFPTTAPFIPNEEMEKIWGHGFTKTQKLNGNVDNLGAYLSAHVSDIPLEEAINNNLEYDEKDIKTIYKIDGKKLDKPKYFIKGARLNLYPPGFKLYRTSRGIKKPKKEYMTYKEAKEKIGLAEPTYSKSIQLTDIDGQFNSKIIYEHYNIKRKKYSKKTNIEGSDTNNNSHLTKHGFFLSFKSCILTCYNQFNCELISIYMRIKKYLKLMRKKRK